MSQVDVVVPCYNYGRFLRACVESVLAQHGIEVRILVLDDASPDNTPDIAAALMRQDSRVQYRRHLENWGHIDTYNEGLLEWASSEYSMLLSADDRLAQGALGRAVRVLESQPAVGMVHGQQRLFDGGEQSGPDEQTDYHECSVTVVSGQAFVENCCECGHNPVATPTVVVRTALQHSVGGYRKALPHSGDLEMWLRLASRSAVAHIKTIQAFKRMHPSNMQHGYLQDALGDLNERYKAFESFFQVDGRILPNCERFRALAIEQLGEQAFWAASTAFEHGDEDGYSRCLEYAIDLAPRLKHTPAWNRLVWKRRLGRRAFHLVKPITDKLLAFMRSSERTIARC